MALPRGENRVFLSWRLLASDAPDAPFFVERCTVNAPWTRITQQPLTTTTTFVDTAPTLETYRYRIVDAQGMPSAPISVEAGAAPSLCILDIPLDPADERTQHLVVGELENDGRLGFVIRSARRDRIWFIAYSYDGRHLWEYDTGLPARGGWDGGMNHVPFLCWDVNGDGRTEFVCHSYDPSRGPYPTERYDTAIPGERLTALDAETGTPVWHAPWPAVKSRVMMTVGHLQGFDQAASIVVLDETYGDVVLTAMSGQNGSTWWRVDQARGAGHNLDIADIDGDGLQEVICGGICYNADGTLRWEAEPFGHTDISKPAKIDPDREGLQIWYAVEKPRDLAGVYMVDKDGKTLFKEKFGHAHYGWIARHAPGIPGLHPHTAEDARTEQKRDSAQGHFPVYLPDGTHWLNLTEWQRKNFVPVHWDERPEVSFIIRKENKRVVRLLPNGEIEELPESKLPEGGEYGRNLACVDVAGDFRENIVTVDTERHRLIVLANPIPNQRRGYSPWDSFDYRHDRSQLGSGYYVYLSPPITTV